MSVNVIDEMNKGIQTAFINNCVPSNSEFRGLNSSLNSYIHILKVRCSYGENKRTN